MRYLVDFHNGTSDQDIDSYLSTNGCTVLKEWDHFDKVFLVEASVEPPVTSIVQFVKNDDHLEIKPLSESVVVDQWHAHQNPNYPKNTISTTNINDWWKNYSLMNVEFDKPTVELAVKGSKVVIYLMDSGIKLDHPEFDGADISNIYTVIPNDYSDTSGHGTSLASVMVGKTCGITNAKIRSVKIFDKNHTTTQSDMIGALDAVINDMKTNNQDIAILNCSWIIDANPYIEDKLRYMMEHGVWVIAAAGNQGTSIEDVTPARMPEVFTVGAYNKDLNPCDFSNYSGGSEISVTPNGVNGGELDGWAPGEQIYVATITSAGYGMVAGTSIACAISSAVLAYNLDDWLSTVGVRHPSMSNAVLVPPSSQYNNLIVKRMDLLDLSDPKYALSVNKIATIIDKLTELSVLPADEGGFTCRVGDPRLPKAAIYLPLMTTAVTIETPLPNGVTLGPDGKLYVECGPDVGPQEGETYKLYTLVFTRTLDNTYAPESVRGTTETVTIKMYVVNSDYNKEELSPDHDVNLLMQNFCGAPCTLFISVQFCGPLCYSGLCMGGPKGQATYMGCL